MSDIAACSISAGMIDMKFFPTKLVSNRLADSNFVHVAMDAPRAVSMCFRPMNTVSILIEASCENYTWVIDKIWMQARHKETPL